ncbi:MAG: DinB family protein, partial [Candidatus Kariarchaeaceae archaeon]
MTVSEIEKQDDVAFLSALATRVEGKGQLNIAKLLRAGLTAIIRQNANNINLSKDSMILVEHLEMAKQIFSKYGLNNELILALQNGKEAMHSGRYPMKEDITDPQVCRRCGNVEMRKINRICPKCGVWADTYQLFPPIYWLNRFNPKEVLYHLENTLELVNSFLVDLDEEILTRKLPDSDWSMHNVVTHLRDAQGVLKYRVKLFVDQEHPQITSQAVFEWATEEDETQPSTQEIFKIYQDSRKETLSILKNLSMEKWWKTG